MVDTRSAATPARSRFAPKDFQVITREKRLQDCAAELGAFLEVMRHSGPKLGPLLFQLDASIWVESLPILADLYAMDSMPKLDRTTTDFTSIRLLGKRSAIPDGCGRVRVDWKRELTMMAGRTQEDLGPGLAVSAFANNRFQGHGPATARTLPGKVAEAIPRP